MLKLECLQNTSSLQVSEHLYDVLGHGRRSWQMVTGGLESVLISGPVDSDNNAIGGGVGVGSLGDGTDILWFRSNLFLAAAFGDLGAIGALKIEGVTAIGVHFAVG